MYELVANIHIHSKYSDGAGTYKQIAEAALSAGLDVAVVSDHNIFVNGLECYHSKNGQQTLILTGEELHDRTLLPSKNHLLVFGVEKELAGEVSDKQALINRVNQEHGLSFIAHPFDRSLLFAGESSITWEDWQIDGYTGIEIWNVMSELKSNLKTYIHAMFYAFFPPFAVRSADPSSLSQWDRLLNEGNIIVGIGGSDAHSQQYTLGPLRAVIFPYIFLFRCVNTHIFIPQPLTGDPKIDKNMVFNALRKGNAFIAYDLPHSTKGFRFTAKEKEQSAFMGEEMTITHTVELSIDLPAKCRCRLLKNGEVFHTWLNKKEEISQTIIGVTQPGVYRIECLRFFKGGWRGWIYSNPIYLRSR